MSNNKQMTERIIDEKVMHKGIHILDYFQFDIKMTVSHLLLTLEMMYNHKIGQDEIVFYQNVLYWVTRVYKPKNGQNSWQICPICGLYDSHKEDCKIKMYNGNKTNK
jgi:hypothetical protein